MNILLVLIPVTLLIVLIAIGVFFWAVNHQQFEDMDSPAVLPLMEDDPATPPDTTLTDRPDATSAASPSSATRTTEQPSASP
ncbi:cbb3-type cytochrome oxidase assembly protein CcoS [Rhodanobacter sp. 115]|uniref:cbb3-type cytochrome oxidase assembly protein CcoS n=1 Tax=Rhodanobacter sp. FW021-MT20 TaxID=1162282 RepID=UPI000260C602|nr:cbb3-type cytochrome oxidase assembly protein CcoS [Rhodanobacter sp. 115]EIL89006.1 cbb3-type cytochrome oxidase maturation protein [Rhodanobacter sp. 115]EIM03781.1 cbb3-type cytochrome oxidase maturation protein [Rhodanobacter sp. 115]